MLVDDDGGAGDAMARVAVFLAWEDLAAITSCCRALRDPETSAFYSAWLARSTLILPSDSRATHDVLAMVKDINAVVVPHSKWLDMALKDESLAPRLARIHRVKLDRTRYQVKPRHALDLGVIAQAFPSTTHLTIHRLDYLNSIEGLRAFRGGLRCLDISVCQRNTPLAISAAEWSSLEELKLTRVNIQNIESMGSMINLRSLEINEVGSIGDLSFLRQLPTLTTLILKSTTVAGPAVRDLLTAAPRLTHFACKQVESIWPSDTTTGRVDGIDGLTLALAFKKLESLTIDNEARLLDLSSISLISSLRELHVWTVDDIRPLRNLVCLERLRFRTTTRIDLTPLAELPHLVAINHVAELNESNGVFDTLSVPFPQLRSFAGPFSSLQQMSELDNLRTLRVVSSPDSQCQLPCTSLPRLHTLKIPRNFDTSGLYQQFPHLRELRLISDDWSTPISDVLAHVARLQDLESLDLVLYVRPFAPPTQDLDFESIAALRKLRKLQIRYAFLKTFYGIERVLGIRELHLVDRRHGCWMAPTLDLSPLEKLPHLQVLLIPDIRITDVTAITRMPTLRVVELPRTVDCCRLVIAYHAHRLRLPGAPRRLDLQELKQGSRNSLWGDYYYSKRVREQLKAMANGFTASQQPVDVAHEASGYFRN